MDVFCTSVSNGQYGSLNIRQAGWIFLQLHIRNGALEVLQTQAYTLRLSELSHQVRPLKKLEQFVFSGALRKVQRPKP